MNAWLQSAAAALAAAAGVDEAELALTDAEAERVLSLASLAAHDSGARLNAPLVCFLAGRAAASGVPVDLLVRAVEDPRA